MAVCHDSHTLIIATTIAEAFEHKQHLLRQCHVLTLQFAPFCIPMQVTNHFEMPRTRSQVPGGLPQLRWETAAAAAARDARATERATKRGRGNETNGGNEAPDADRENALPDADCNPAAANAEDSEEPDPHE